ncbi:MAG: hypothetical protein WCL39_00030 [Armatimonadota bacterium]
MENVSAYFPTNSSWWVSTGLNIKAPVKGRCRPWLIAISDVLALQPPFNLLLRAARRKLRHDLVTQGIDRRLIRITVSEVEE